MSAPVIAAPPGEAERLEQLEAAFLRSPSSAWPVPSPATAMPVAMPLDSPDELGGPEQRISKYNTYGLCCR
jgi:hypothetical protein